MVTTGQQPGLFGGPIYTWTKAVSALALADTIEATTGIPAAPFFWAASDDSDFAEGSWTMVSLPGGAERLALAERPDDGVRLADAPLGDVSPLLETLVRASGSAADQRPLDAVRRAFMGPTTLGKAYVSLLRELLEPLGIVVLDAAHPAVSQTAHPLLVRALREHRRLDESLTERTSEMRGAGFEPQVTPVADRTLVFELVEGRRQRVSHDRAERVAGSSEPGRLSANVLLRPIVERTLLPTVGYLAGPGELAYFAQVSAVAEALGEPVPLAVPRWSATIIEPHIAQLLASRDLEPSDFAEPHALETRLARAAWPDDLAREFSRLQDALRQRTVALRSVLEADGALADPTTVEAVERGIAWRLQRFERRVTAAVKRREAGLMHDLATLRGALYPNGVRQERALNVLPILARQGLALLDGLRSHAANHARALVGADVARAATP